MQYILYRNNRKYSNIKFSSFDEVKDYIKFNTSLNTDSTNIYDIYKYETGLFQRSLVVTVKACYKTISFDKYIHDKIPRTKSFYKK